MSITYCIDPRCTTSQRCWREANERYGNAPGENYGPRCIPAPPSVEQTYARGKAEERAAVVAWIKRDALQEDRTYEQMVLMGWIAQEIERGEHRREREPVEDDSIEYRDIAKED